MKYKCTVELEPIPLEVEGEDYTNASLNALIKATEQLKSTPFKVLVHKLSVKCFKLE